MQFAKWWSLEEVECIWEGDGSSSALAAMSCEGGLLKGKSKSTSQKLVFPFTGSYFCILVSLEEKSAHLFFNIRWESNNKSMKPNVVVTPHIKFLIKVQNLLMVQDCGRDNYFMDWSWTFKLKISSLAFSRWAHRRAQCGWAGSSRLQAAAGQKDCPQ